MRYAAAFLVLITSAGGVFTGAGTGVAHAQQPRGAVVPESITVGDVFHAAVRIDLADDARIAAPDSLDLGEDLEHAGRREVRIDTAGGVRRATVLYPLAAWRPGSYELAAIPIRVVSTGRDTVMHVRLPEFEVSSVLPADTTGIEAKPAKDVLGANRLWWPILLALLIAALIATALYVWWKRRRGRAGEPVVFTPAVPPQEVALAQLAALRREGLIERGEFKVFYERLTETLRHYLAEVDSSWSVDLTTSELALRLRADAGMQDALEMTRILGAADMVKFARASSTRDNATADLNAAHAWVERFAVAPASDPADELEAA